MFDNSNNMDTEDERLVDVALTVSSAVDWVVAGDEYSAAETRLRVVPTGPTLAGGWINPHTTPLSTLLIYTLDQSNF